MMSAAYAVRGSPAAPNGRCAILPSSRAREDGAPVLELVDVARRLVAEDLDRVLVAEVVGALDRVERVLLGVVLGRVAERRVDPAFGRAGVAADAGGSWRRWRRRRPCRTPRSRRASRRSRRRRRARRASRPRLRTLHERSRRSARYGRAVRRPARSSRSARNPAGGIGQSPPDTARSRGRAARRDSGPTDSADPELHSTTCFHIRLKAVTRW